MTREEKERKILDRLRGIGNLPDIIVDILYTLLLE